MRLRLPTSRRPAWLAVLAIALNASWPALALATPKALMLPVELCTSGGVTTASAHGSIPASPSSEASHAAHCAFCSSGAAKLPGLPNPSLPSVHCATLAHAQPAPQDPLPAGPIPLPGRPRGPPTAS